MEELKKLLTDPFDGKRTDEIAKTVENIAKTLFRDYYIDCNGKIFYFAEIEFYYWQNDEFDKGFNQEWNRVTYPRKKKAGQLLFHLSGVDICFESSYDEENLEAPAKFGGILIRSIKDEKGEVIAGPWNCMLEILNECGGEKMPQIKKLNKRHNNKMESTYRALGKDDIDKEKVNPFKLCFYDSSIPKEKWGKKVKISLVKKTGKLEWHTSSYKTDRFELEG